jgi:hypothetical protein
VRLAVGAGKAAPVRGCVLPWWSRGVGGPRRRAPAPRVSYRSIPIKAAPCAPSASFHPYNSSTKGKLRVTVG